MNYNGFKIYSVGHGHWMVEATYCGKPIKRIVTDSQLIDNAKSDRPNKEQLRHLRSLVRQGTGTR